MAQDDTDTLTPDVEVEETEEPAQPAAAAPSGGLILATEVLPETIPIFPLRGRPFFPGMPAPLELRGDQIPILQYAAEKTRATVGVVLVKDPAGSDAPENLNTFGTAARLVRAMQTDAETAHVLINCVQRLRIEAFVPGGPGIQARVKYLPEPELSVHDELKAYAMAVVGAMKDLAALNPLQAEAIKLFLSRSSLEDPGRLADVAASLTTADAPALQEVLESLDVRKRIDRVLVLLKREIQVARLQEKINKQIEEKISEQQRDFFLREQLKAIKKELGLEKEGKESEIEKFQKRLETRTLNDEAKSAVEDEMEKLQLIEPASPEYAVSRNYLDWLTILPWGVFSKDTFDVDRARKILDRDHHGLEDVKERILEFIAVGKMRGDITGSTLCLVGPPGVGKTSVGKSIAEAIGRRFFRFSLGGMRDEAEIKGHRRTYIGAMPGKFIQAMKTAGTANPLIMLDEIDKVGASFQGDPASALLEVLDPEQNATFRDHYLDVPFDLSHVLFISTANQLDTIPPPLLDRMELIRLSGYVLQEKVEIARRFLVPKNLKAHGLGAGQVTFTKEALAGLADGYAREAGVRGLENLIKKILRKAAMRLSKDPKAKIAVGKDDLQAYLGKPVFTADEVFEGVRGVVTGLAWTSLGGATLQVEATAVPAAAKGFRQTGQLGSVMQESAEIAYSYVMAHLADLGAPPNFFDTHHVHLHVPAGATPKDGPSAGITMATALVSMATGRLAKKSLAMTGELTLTGQVLPIGGLKEKVIAARRLGIKTLIFPEGNRGDFEELPDYLRKGLTVVFARRFEDVVEAAFPARSKRAGGR